MKAIFLTFLFATGIAPTLATAQEPMTAAEFERYVEGKTLYFRIGGDEYGAERYLGNRRVEWSFLDGDCKEGYWYEKADQICFVYDDNPSPQCWTFFHDVGGLKAIFENEPNATTLYEAQQNDDPMLCYGPKVGV